MDANSVASATEKTKIMDLPTISSDAPQVSKVRECILWRRVCDEPLDVSMKKQGGISRYG